jgi:hypothetical protein
MEIWMPRAIECKAAEWPANRWSWRFLPMISNPNTNTEFKFKVYHTYTLQTLPLLHVPANLEVKNEKRNEKVGSPAYTCKSRQQQVTGRQ